MCTLSTSRIEYLEINTHKSTYLAKVTEQL